MHTACSTHLTPLDLIMLTTDGDHVTKPLKGLHNIFSAFLFPLSVSKILLYRHVFNTSQHTDFCVGKRPNFTPIQIGRQDYISQYFHRYIAGHEPIC